MGFLSFLVFHNVVFMSVAVFGLGTWVYFERRYEARSVTMGALLVTVSFWSFAMVLWRMAPDARQAQFWLRALYSIGATLPALLLLFAWTLKNGSLPSVWKQAALLLPNALLFALIFWTDIIITPGALGQPALVGSGFLWLATYYAALLSVALVVVWLSYRRTDTDRKMLAPVLIGAVIAFDSVFAVLFAGLPVANSDFFWLSDTALLIGILILVFGLVRDRLLLDLKPVSTEVFAFLALLIVVADIVVSQTSVDFALRLTTLIVVVFYGVLLSRNLVREAQHLAEMRRISGHVIAMNGRLLESDRAKTQFLSFASHQLRAPLGGMRSYLDMMNKGDFGAVTERQHQILDLNLGVINQTLQTIETFLSVTRIELGKLEMYYTQVGILDLVGRVIDGVRPLAERKGLTIDVDIPPQIGSIKCDGGKIYHVLLNLVDNAIKYSDQGTIKITGTREPGRVLVRVSDNGIGLSTQEREHLFELFRRGLSAARMNANGAGLGLFLAKHIVTAHGGDILVESAGKGQGSTFGFWLPA